MANSSGSVKIMDDVAPGWIDVWRLWRHCLCRFGWYPLFVAPLVTCACLLDLYSSTGCDFIRMDIGFVPANDVWSTGSSQAESSQAQLGLFSFDSHITDRNKWKRSFNNGCQLYSSNFENVFIANDQTWHVSRIMAYISGISSLVALATAWLLTITPLPASFFWPGVLLPAVVLSMLTGAAKFLFFDTQICTEPLWYLDDASEAPVAARSCEIGESSVFGIASVAAYFFCMILICFRSPQKRTLDENWGKRLLEQQGSTITHNSVMDNLVCHDPEQGGHPGSGGSNGSGVVNVKRNNSGNHLSAIAENESMGSRTMKNKNDTPQVIEHGQHTRSTSDVTWSTGSNKNLPNNFTERSRNLGVLSPPTTISKTQPEGGQPVPDWSTYGRPIVVTINDSNRGGPQSLSYSDGSNTQSNSKSPASRGGKPALPPRHNGNKTTINNNNGNNGNNNNSSQRSISRSNSTSNSNEYQQQQQQQQDAGSVSSRISRLSFAETHASDELSALGMQSYSATSSTNKSAPSVVNIPSRRTKPGGGGSRHHTFTGGTSPGGSSGGKHRRYGKQHGGGSSSSSRSTREDRNDQSQVFLNEQAQNQQRDGMMLENLPPLDEMSTARSEDHGDLINQCVRDLQNSFDDNGFRTM